MASPKTVRPYQWLAIYCDRMVAFHRPLFAKALQQILGSVAGGVESVCDLACGTGHNKGEDRAWADVEWFIKEGPLWRRHHEHVEEVCWTRREISDGLRAAGLKIVGTFDATLFFQNDHLTLPGYRTCTC